MSATTLIRQVHRWVSVAFVAAFLFTSYALATKLPLAWAPYTPLPFLFLLAITGIYMFVLPYLGRRTRRS